MIWNIIGYSGSILILFSFVMVTRAKWQAQQKRYLLVSLFGSILLTIYQLWLGAYAGVITSFVFSLVAVWSLVAKPQMQAIRRPKK